MVSLLTKDNKGIPTFLNDTGLGRLIHVKPIYSTGIGP